MTLYAAYNETQIYFLRVYILSSPQHWFLSIYADKFSIPIPCFSDLSLGFFTAALSRYSLPVPWRDGQTAAFLEHSCVLYGDPITKGNISALPWKAQARKNSLCLVLQGSHTQSYYL